jgi:uncharacterized protein (TIGR02466 family)
MNTPFQAVVHPLYAVPMMSCQLPDPGALNARLAVRFLAMEAQGLSHRDSTVRDTQHGIFESHFHLHQYPDADIQQLFVLIAAALRNFIQGINQFDDATMDSLVLDMHSWFHITRTGGYQGAHNHPNASWSAIYCIDPGDSDQPNSGAVRFHDPRLGADMYRDPANDHLQLPYKLGSWQLQHKPGQMLVFPSYLLHEIFPYQGSRPRIVVALNCWCRQPS